MRRSSLFRSRNATCIAKKSSRVFSRTIVHGSTYEGGKKWSKGRKRERERERERERKLSTRFVRFSRKADAVAVHGVRQEEIEEIKVHPVFTCIRTYVHPRRVIWTPRMRRARHRNAEFHITPAKYACSPLLSRGMVFRYARDGRIYFCNIFL